MQIVLGVTGSIAAYRACDLARDLKRAGHAVRVILTPAAAEFVSPLLFEGLTGEPCLVDTFDEPVRGKMAHIDWARYADLVIVAPASANTINKVAHGEATDMLTTMLLAYEGPVLVCPAMNPSMYSNEATQKSLRLLRDRGVFVLEPTEGDVACGEQGQGKLIANSEILSTANTILSRSQKLAKKHILITSGSTQEPIDDVRYITNRSSGKMGASLAHAAILMGARVTVITGPTSVAIPSKAKIVRVQTADQMLESAKVEAPSADLIIGAAAVGDFRVKEPHQGKMRREGNLSLELVPNPDILAELARAHPSAAILAFAAEIEHGTKAAQEKMERKGAAAIALNDVGNPAIGFESDENEITLIFKDGLVVESGRASKLQIAFWLLEQVADQILLKE